MKLRVDRDAVARDWRARGFTCDLWVDPPAQVWADFVHDMDEMVTLVEGEKVRNVGGVTSRWLYGYKTLRAQ